MNSNPDNQQLANAVKALAVEHEALFKCAVAPGFQAEAQQGDLDIGPASLAGSALIPIAAREFRNYYIYQWLKATGRVTDPNDMRAKFGIDLNPVEDLIYDPGAFLGSLGRFVGIGWKRDESKLSARNATYQTSVSQVAITELFSSIEETMITLEVPTTTFILSVRDRATDLKPKLAVTLLIYLTDRISSFPVPLTVNGKVIQILGPVAAVAPNENGLSLINTTHVIPHNISSEPIPVDTYMDDLVARAAIKALIPETTDSDLLFRKATIKLSYNATYVQSLGLTIDAATDITIFDLVSGLPLQGVVYQPDINGGSFEAVIGAGNGSWGRGWGGGGSFALGFLKHGGNASASSSSATHGITPAVTTPAAHVGDEIWSGLGGAAAPVTTIGHTWQSSSLNATRNGTVFLSSPTSSILQFTGGASSAGVPWFMDAALVTLVYFLVLSARFTMVLDR